MAVEATSYRHAEHEAVEVVAGGSLAETIGGAGAVVLAILALAGILPGPLAAVATIGVGAALLFEGASIAAEFQALRLDVVSNRTEASELGGGMTAETLAGLAGVALGILALLGLAPTTLMAVALIVFGGGLLLGSVATARLNDLKIRGEVSDTARTVARASVETASGAQILVGAGGVVLGILALVGLAPATLIAVGMLSLGASVLFSGSAVGGKMLAILQH